MGFLSRIINNSRKRILRKRISQIIGDINPPRILDNGCGIEGSFDYNHFEKRVTCADISTNGIDCQKLPYKNNSFDCVIFAGVLQYIPDKNKAIKECFRVLKKGGTLIISTINYNSFINKITGFRSEITVFSKKSFLDIISSEGFTIKSFSFIDFKIIPKKMKMILLCVCKK